MQKETWGQSSLASKSMAQPVGEGGYARRRRKNSAHRPGHEEVKTLGRLIPTSGGQYKLEAEDDSESAHATEYGMSVAYANQMKEVQWSEKLFASRRVRMGSPAVTKPKKHNEEMTYIGATHQALSSIKRESMTYFDTLATMASPDAGDPLYWDQAAGDADRNKGTAGGWGGVRPDYGPGLG